jgi:hypothetical protein
MSEPSKSKSAMATEGLGPAVPEISASVEESSMAFEENPIGKQPVVIMDLAAEGAKRSELMQEIWGNHGKLLVFIG